MPFRARRIPDVPRAERIRVRYQDLKGNVIETGAEGYLARIMQHEIDHTDGILFIDRIDPEKSFSSPMRSAK